MDKTKSKWYLFKIDKEMGITMKKQILLGALMALPLMANANGKVEKYFLGDKEYIIGKDVREYGDYYGEYKLLYNVFAGHTPNKTTPLTKTIKGYKTYCFSQAGVFLSDLAYSSTWWHDKKSHFKAIDFCQEPMVDLILSESKKVKKPNFSHGLRLITIHPKEYPNVAYTILVDEKEKVIYTNNAVFFSYNKPFDYLFFSIDNKSTKFSSLGQLVSYPKDNKFCFTGKNIGNMGTEVATYEGKYEFMIEASENNPQRADEQKCGFLVVGKNGIKYQLKTYWQLDWADSETSYPTYRYTQNGLEVKR